jgi:hypothetical protein
MKMPWGGGPAGGLAGVAREDCLGSAWVAAARPSHAKQKEFSRSSQQHGSLWGARWSAMVSERPAGFSWWWCVLLLVGGVTLVWPSGLSAFSQIFPRTGGRRRRQGSSRKH